MDSSSYYGFPRDFLFIMTKDDIGDIPIYNYDKMVCAFGRNRFYSSEEIPSFGPGKANRYKPVKITDKEEGIFVNPRLVDLWTRQRHYIAISVDNIFPSGYEVWW